MCLNVLHNMSQFVIVFSDYIGISYALNISYILIIVIKESYHFAIVIQPFDHSQDNIIM